MLGQLWPRGDLEEAAQVSHGQHSGQGTPFTHVPRQVGLGQVPESEAAGTGYAFLNEGQHSQEAGDGILEFPQLVNIIQGLEEDGELRPPQLGAGQDGTLRGGEEAEEVLQSNLQGDCLRVDTAGSGSMSTRNLLSWFTAASWLIFWVSLSILRSKKTRGLSSTRGSARLSSDALRKLGPSSWRPLDSLLLSSSSWEDILSISESSELLITTIRSSVSPVSLVTRLLVSRRVSSRTGLSVSEGPSRWRGETALEVLGLGCSGEPVLNLSSSSSVDSILMIFLEQLVWQHFLFLGVTV